MGLGVLVLVGGIAVWQGFFAGRDAKARAALANQHGWTYSEGEDQTQWRMVGTLSGASFVADAKRPRYDGPPNAANPHRTRFTAQVPGGAAVRVEPAGLDELPETAAAALKWVMGPPADQLRREAPV